MNINNWNADYKIYSIRKRNVIEIKILFSSGQIRYINIFDTLVWEHLFNSEPGIDFFSLFSINLYTNW